MDKNKVKQLVKQAHATQEYFNQFDGSDNRILKIKYKLQCRSVRRLKKLIDTQKGVGTNDYR